MMFTRLAPFYRPLFQQTVRRTFHAGPLLNDTRSPSAFTNFLASESPPPVQVSSITPSGLLLADGLIIPSACIFLDGKVFLWDVPETLWHGWNKDHFEIFEAVVPKPGESLNATLRLLSVSDIEYHVCRNFIVRDGEDSCITASYINFIFEWDWNPSWYHGHGGSLGSNWIFGTF